MRVKVGWLVALSAFFALVMFGGAAWLIYEKVFSLLAKG